MGAMINKSTIRFLADQHPDVHFTDLTGQQEQALMFHLRGCSIPQAAEGAGYSAPGHFRTFLNRPSTQILLGYLRDRVFQEVRVTRESVTQMFMEAFHKAGTSSEMTMAARELGKLHGLYPDSKATTQISVKTTPDGGQEVSIKKLQNLSDEELLQLADPSLAQDLVPSAPIDESTVIEGELDDESPQQDSE